MTTTVLNTKISEVENKIPDTSSLHTTTVLNAKFSELKIKVHDHVKCITTQEFKKLAAESFLEKVNQADLVTKTDFENKLISFN